MSIDENPTSTNIGLSYDLEIEGVEETVSVGIVYNLSEGQIKMEPKVDFSKTPNIALWDFVLRIGSLEFTNNSTFLDNGGHGVLRTPPSKH